MTPITVSGFNWDVVIENTARTNLPLSAYAAELNPGEGNAFYQSGFSNRSYGLPISGSYTSVLDNATVFMFQPYTGNNALVLSSDTGVSSGTLTLQSPAVYNRIAVVANSASANSTSAGTLTISFSDGSTFVTNYNAPDWFNNSGYALNGTERINLNSGSTSGATGNPRFYQTSYDLNANLGGANKPIASFTFGKASGANSTGIYSVSGELSLGIPAVILTNPASLTVNELSPANFSVVVGGNPTPALQWYKNSVAIPGATNLTYAIAAAALSDNGAAFKLVANNVVSNISYSVTSAPATLTVIADTNKPVLLSAQSYGLSQVIAGFSERIKLSTATNRANYSLTGTNGSLVISNAVLDASQSNVVLTVATLTDRAFYTLTVNNLADQSAAANVIAPNSQAAFYASTYIQLAIGNPTPNGSQSPGGNGLNISGGGADLGGTSDQFQFSYQQYTGDFDVKVRLDSLTLADAWSEAAMLAREDLSPGARSASVVATPSISGCYFQSRTATNGATSLSGTFPVSYPNTWLRLTRSGSTFTGYAGFDGLNWSQLGTTSIAMPATIYFGFAVSSHNTNQLSTAAFRDFGNVTTVGTNSPPTYEPLGQASRRTSLVISEIMYQPTNSNLEFVELFNSRGEFQDISGYQIGGDINYQFPTGTVIPGGGFLLIARSPSDLQTAYGLSGVLGPYTNHLPNGGGTIQLFNQAGALLLEVDYDGKAPWPLAANGAGHSLVLSRPSYGQNNPQAWSASDAMGGSPGRLDPYPSDPLRNVVINEILAHTDPPLEDSFELYNHSNDPKDLSGAWLSDDLTTNKFRIPNGTILPPRGFVVFGSSTLGFGLSKLGEYIVLVNSNRTRVIDAVQYGPQENGVSLGRIPDGTGDFYRLAARTLGTNNGAALLAPVVINELMYNPISGLDDDQYVELYNRSASAVNLTDWRFTSGVDYTFPTNTILAANAYLVIAKNPARLIANYGNLTLANCLGPFSGKLSHGGERLALGVPYYYAVTNNGFVKTNIAHIDVNEVTYCSGGRWGQWSDAGGSSLELIDPDSDNRLAPNWADSDETHKAPWTVFSNTGTIDNGTTAANEVQMLLEAPGECLIDNVQINVPGIGNVVTNGTFETDVGGWVAEGTQSASSLETTEGYGSFKSYHIRAAEKGDNQINRIRALISTSIASGATNVTISFAARWLKGDPQALVRLRGNWLDCPGDLTLPNNLGTPGAQNSRFVANAGPAITAVQHSPILPAAGQPIIVTARVNDPDGIAALVVKYRQDPSATYSTVAMIDDGTGGDAIAGDGIYSATIPGQTNGTMVAFYIYATDLVGPPGISTFPNDAPTRECLVRVGELQPPGNFPMYRVWMTAAALNQWNTRLKLDNTYLDITFVNGNSRVIYNGGGRYKGSPYISPGYSGATSGRCGYTLTMPPDDVHLGETELVFDWPGGHGSETTAMQEEMCYYIADKLNLPWSHRYIARLHVNGVTDDARHATFEAVVQPDGSFVNEWVPTDDQGQLFKIERGFEFNDTAGLIADPEPRLSLFTTTGGVKKREKYRWNWLIRSTGLRDNYTNIFALVDAVNAASPEPYNSATLDLVDMEEWMGVFATEHIIVNFDAYGHEIGKNMYAYLPPNGKWKLFMFDLDWAMLPAVSHNSSYAPLTAPLFNTDDPTIARMYAFPPFARAYYRTLQNAVNGPLQAANCNPVMDAKYKSLVGNGINWCDGSALTDPSAVKTWFAQRLIGLQSNLASVAAPFAINSSTISNNMAIVSGSAPIPVQTIWFNGAAYPVTWTTVSNWVAIIPLKPGTNDFSVVGVDPSGQGVSGATNSLSVVYGGTAPSPVGQLVLNEVMYNSPSWFPNSQFVELYNNSPTNAFDLSGWDFHGLSYHFPAGATIAPNSFLLLAANRADFAAAYGPTNVVFDTWPGTLQTDGETLSLVKPGTNSATDLTVTKVRFGSALPWPPTTNGSSLQLLDSTQDNWRVGNWLASLATPGVTNSVITNLLPFPTLWINELQADNLTGITNHYGQHTAWIEIYNPSANTLSLSNLYLSSSYTNLTAWAFPASATIGPGQFKVIFADGQPTFGTELHTSFVLPSGSGSVALSRLYNGQPQVLDYVDYSGLPANRSYGSFPDGQSFDRQIFYYVTPGGTNNATSGPLTVAINEWMAGNTHTLQDPADGNKYDDWFELYNYGSNTVDLTGYYLTDTLTNEFKFQIPSGYTIAPHAFLLVWADNKSTSGTPDLHVTFKMAKSGEQLGLYGSDGTPVDFVTYGVQTDDVSMGRYPDGSGNIFFMTTPTPHTNNIVPNTPPMLVQPTNAVVTLGQTLAFFASATDTDTPPQSLTFSLGSGAPAGASIIPTTGLFSWTPPTAPATNSISIIVTDNGSPSLSATQSFTVVVHPRPTVTAQFSGGQLQLTWPRGILQQADNVTGPYTDVQSVASPYVITPTGLRKFYRIRN
jgi:hypothetical protein